MSALTNCLLIEAKAIADTAEKLDNKQVEHSFKLLKRCFTNKGKLITSGVGKSGIVARKIAATFSSLGLTSLYLNPLDALHGDLGIADSNDLTLIISNSGETREIIEIAPHLKKRGIKFIGIIGNKNSSLKTICDAFLDSSVDRESCPLNLAPTTSTMITMVLGDALAVSLMELKNFKQEDFALTHPGGSLGRRLLSSVKDEMKQNNLPFIDQNAIVQDVLVKMTEGRLGLALVGKKEELKGVITDGDIRRALIDNKNFAELKAKDLMNSNPLTALQSDNLQVAEKRMREAKVQCLIVKNPINEVVGVIQIFE